MQGVGQHQVDFNFLQRGQYGLSVDRSSLVGRSFCLICRQFSGPALKSTSHAALPLTEKLLTTLVDTVLGAVLPPRLAPAPMERVGHRILTMSQSPELKTEWL